MNQTNRIREARIVVRPRSGMQLCEGYIQKDDATCFLGCLPGMNPRAGETLEDVRAHLELSAKRYYGDDVVVEVVRAWSP